MEYQERIYPGDYPLKTRTDVAETLLALIRPLKPFYSKGKAWLHVGYTGVHYGDKAALMEGFARIMWGLGPLWAGENGTLSPELQTEIEEWRQLYLEGIIHGTDPTHEEYWGDVNDYDQKMVEMAALVTSISLSPLKLWEPLTGEQKENLYQWLNQINEREVHPNNWRFFRILVNMTFCILDLEYSKERLKDDFGVIENCYCGKGWYFDGKQSQMDYYIPFAMHFYGLIYARMMETREREYACILKKRADEFSKDFVYWFDQEGREIPYGRSLTYRFAHGACFSAMAYAGVRGVGYGVMKRLVLGNLRSWLKRPIFDNHGVLTIGYTYPNLFMSERYNSPGSPYWGFKTFFMLALSEDHPFWKAEEEGYDYQAQKLLNQPHMLLTHDDGGQVQAYTAGQHCMNHGSCPEKYEKFVYSNQFGFSVSRGNTLEEGAFDNTLAVSAAGENFYRMRYGAEDFHITQDWVSSDYHITDDVAIRSTIVPCMPWHVRIHQIENLRAIDIADGGFAIGAQRAFEIQSGQESGKYTTKMIERSETQLYAKFPWGLSGIAAMTGGEVVLITTFPNTSLFYPLAVLPSVKQRLEPGKHLVINCMVGDKTENQEDIIGKRPEVLIQQTYILIRYQEKTVRIERKGE